MDNEWGTLTNLKWGGNGRCTVGLELGVIYRPQILNGPKGIFCLDISGLHRMDMSSIGTYVHID